MYGAELAEIYEMVYVGRGKDYRQEARDMVELVRDQNPDATSLLDVGCATGVHLVYFDELFDRVAGLELSPAMVSVAGSRLGDGVVHQGDMRSFDLGQSFDVITCMFGTIGHALTETDLAACLRRFEAHLAPRGVALVDPWWFAETFTDGYVAGDVCTADGRTVARVSHAVRDGDRSRTNVHYVVANPGRGVRHFEETYVARLFSREQYEQAFRSTGFTTKYIDGIQSGRGLFVAVRDQ